MSRAAVIIAAVICAAPAHAETAYFATIPDVPIAPGLRDAGDNWEFSDARARVIGASARGQAQAEQVRAFYQTALPPLGWAISVGGGGENEAIYLRGREQLSLSFHLRGEELLLQAIVFVGSAPRD
ncbi:hypothetical protein [Terricaulis silvestris]|uniref:Uncharacterized protein n=1 Tax=Terricaulis silvestris TaxID=2686094 RepID=A0A6I6MXT5_9CAUL|nr:hypothetical protein [Terricaulis silvestris]QGZ97134.1 hypothetical protein DSM104635_04000 [Terricaulis silvestris]